MNFSKYIGKKYATLPSSSLGMKLEFIGLRAPSRISNPVHRIPPGICFTVYKNGDPRKMGFSFHSTDLMFRNPEGHIYMLHEIEDDLAPEVREAIYTMIFSDPEEVKD